MLLLGGSWINNYFYTAVQKKDIVKLLFYFLVGNGLVLYTCFSDFHWSKLWVCSKQEDFPHLNQSEREKWGGGSGVVQ